MKKLISLIVVVVAMLTVRSFTQSCTVAPVVTNVVYNNPDNGGDNSFTVTGSGFGSTPEQQNPGHSPNSFIAIFGQDNAAGFHSYDYMNGDSNWSPTSLVQVASPGPAGTYFVVVVVYDANGVPQASNAFKITKPASH
jgi:hypothetical protein